MPYITKLSHYVIENNESLKAIGAISYKRTMLDFTSILRYNKKNLQHFQIISLTFYGRIVHVEKYGYFHFDCWFCFYWS